MKRCTKKALLAAMVPWLFLLGLCAVVWLVSVLQRIYPESPTVLSIGPVAFWFIWMSVESYRHTKRMCEREESRDGSPQRARGE